MPQSFLRLCCWNLCPATVSWCCIDGLQPSSLFRLSLATSWTDDNTQLGLHYRLFSPNFLADPSMSSQTELACKYAALYQAETSSIRTQNSQVDMLHDHITSFCLAEHVRQTNRAINFKSNHQAGDNNLLPIYQRVKWETNRQTGDRPEFPSTIHRPISNNWWKRKVWSPCFLDAGWFLHHSDSEKGASHTALCLWMKYDSAIPGGTFLPGGNHLHSCFNSLTPIKVPLWEKGWEGPFQVECSRVGRHPEKVWSTPLTLLGKKKKRNIYIYIRISICVCIGIIPHKWTTEGKVATRQAAPEPLQPLVLSFQSSFESTCQAY